MGMLDAVVYNLVNQIKTLSTTINTKMDMLVGGWNDQLTELRVGLTDTRIGFLDYLNSLENRLTTLWANQLTSLRTDITSARAGYLDLINTINTRLSSTWAAKLDSIRTAYTDTRAANLDAIPETRLVKIDQLRTNLTDQRSANLDLIPGIISGLGRAPKVRVKKPVATNYFASGTNALYIHAGANMQNVSVAGTSGATTTTTILNITGSGKLKQLFAQIQCALFSVTSPVFSCTINVYIDGFLYVSVERSKSAGWATGTTFSGPLAVIGDLVPYYNGSNINTHVCTNTEEVVFNSSLKIDVIISCLGGTYTSTYASMFYEYETN